MVESGLGLPLYISSAEIKATLMVVISSVRDTNRSNAAKHATILHSSLTPYLPFNTSPSKMHVRTIVQYKDDIIKITTLRYQRSAKLF